MKKLISIVLLLTITKAFSQVNIVPQPAEVKMKTGNYILSANTKIIYGKGAEKQVQYLQDYLKNNYNLNLSSSLYNGNSAALNIL
jgi:hypothetical protein